MATIISGTGSKLTFTPNIFLAHADDSPGGKFFTETSNASFKFDVAKVDVPVSFRGGVQVSVPGEITWQVTGSGLLSDCAWPATIDGEADACSDDAVDFGGADFKGDATLFFNDAHNVKFNGIMTELTISTSGRDVGKFDVTIKNTDGLVSTSKHVDVTWS